MHPAPSLIVFTVLSGLGFGLLAFLGLGLPAPTGWAAFWLFGLGYALAGTGLVAAAFHLGHPERALRAFTQWRTSWLSREAVLSVAALLAMAPHAAGSVFLGQPLPLLGAVAAVLCALTVLATAMIYAQIRAVPRWHHWTTPAVFLAAAASGGALLAGLGGVAAGALVVLAAAMALHWAAGDGRRRQPGSTPETATGLGFLGRVRLLAPPHTGTNYLLREMVHVVGRRHAARLRVLALGLGVAVPLALLAVPGGGWPLALAAAVVHAVGMAAARWLFFAEAEHAVGLYYGRR